ncbi:MAG: metallophosphoesterase [Phycisphaerae bacterium]
MSNPSADQVIETLQTAAEENGLSHLRQGQTIVLPEEGELWMTGDLHDHRRNLDKLIKAADLRTHPNRHLVLHEVIHGDHYDASGAEESWVTLYKVADLKCDFPEQVHFLLANHDLAQVHGKGIMKAGLSVCEAFTKGVKKNFEGQHNVVNAAVSEFLLSLPLAVRAPNGIFCCHSLPTDAQIDTFDFSVFDRPLEGADYVARTGSVYQLIWGRGMTPETANRFADTVGARLLITGHQPQEMGFTTNGDRHLIMASDHNQGVFLPINLAQEYTLDDLVNNLQKFVSLDL